jgi:hypothetical protein
MKVNSGCHAVVEELEIVEVWTIVAEVEAVVEFQIAHVKRIRPSYLRLTRHRTIFILVVWINRLADISQYWQLRCLHSRWIKSFGKEDCRSCCRRRCPWLGQRAKDPPVVPWISESRNVTFANATTRIRPHCGSEVEGGATWSCQARLQALFL